MKRITLQKYEISALQAGVPILRRVPAEVFRNRPELDSILARHPNQQGCPLGQIGDRFWVAETHTLVSASDYHDCWGIYQKENPQSTGQACIYRENFNRPSINIRWRPSVQMPRWASRFTLQAQSVRVERTNPEAKNGSQEWEWVMVLGLVDNSEAA